MPRPFTSADVVQHADDITATLVADPGVALPAGATEGNGGFIVMGAHINLDPPEQWHRAAQAGVTGSDDSLPILAIMCRPGLLPGDQSWGFLATGGTSARWAWVAEEWTNLSFAATVASARSNQELAPSAKSSGTTGTVDSGYYMAVAAVMLLGGATASAWPTAVSWSNGFTETDVLTFGAGTAAADMQLRVARYYPTGPETGPWETTATFTNPQTGNAVYGCIAVFCAENYDTDV